jgi:hypothetical protein
MLFLAAVDSARFLRSTLAYTMTTFQATEAKIFSLTASARSSGVNAANFGHEEIG